jgi:dipeptidyl aminopeptidase/acylaminoacyl peptidase
MTAADLKVVDISGGPPRTLAHHGRYPQGGTWSREGNILFSVIGQAIQRVSSEGGEPVPVSESVSTQGVMYFFLQFLPDGRHYLYSYADMEGKRDIYIGSLESKSWKKHVLSAKRAEYVEPGYLVFERQGAVFAQAFDASRLELRGEPVILAEATEHTFDGRGFSVSRDALVYREPIESQLTWYDRSGSLLGLVGDPGRYSHIELSPEGDRVAVERIEEIGTADIWVLDLRRGTASRVTSHPAWESRPLWSPDGRNIVFSSIPKGTGDIFETSSAGSGESRTLLETSGNKVPTDWSRDGRYLLYANSEGPSSWLFDLWVLPLSGDEEATSFLSTEFSEREGRFSPDGRWVAYTSDESGRLEVYVRPFPPSEGRWRISLDGGRYPLWRGDGKELYFLRLDGKLMAVQVKGEIGFEAGAPQELFSLRLAADGVRYPYAVTADGQRFLVRTAVDDASPVKVIVNWIAELEQ